MLRVAALVLVVSAAAEGRGLATTPLALPPTGHVKRVELVLWNAGEKTGYQSIDEPSEAEAICVALRRLNSDWLPSAGPDPDHQSTVFVWGDEGGAGFWIGPDWMSASPAPDFVVARRYRRLSSDEREALGAALIPGKGAERSSPARASSRGGSESAGTSW
jgi:hypothetical protein